jgi:NodT family efflux transporter outer membrane factor (OMF) lipoprotein
MAVPQPSQLILEEPMSSFCPPDRRSRIAGPILALGVFALSGCVAVGPNFTPPSPQAPADWTQWRSGEASLRLPVEAKTILPPQWWLAFNDPTLDELERRAAAASPDVETAALHYAQTIVQRRGVVADGLPQINANAQVSRNGQSENGAGIRILDVLAPSARDSIAKVLAEPFTFYQTGLDFSWELDLWGRVRRSLEAADADVNQQAALLESARLVLAADLARSYFEMRSVQSQIRLARDDIVLLTSETQIVSAQVEGGLVSDLPLEQQRVELQRVQAQLPTLVAQEAVYANQIASLIGERPGALNELLASQKSGGMPNLPTLALGLPSEVALRRPDVRAAEARLAGATASIGVARASLYPSVRLGVNFGFESYRQGHLFDWASRTFGITPAIDLPLFDGGRRVSVVALRELEQKEAAVGYQQTVLKAWQEIDDALNAFAAERQQNERLAGRQNSARAASDLATARYAGGLTTYVGVIDARRAFLQAERDRAISDSSLASRYVAVNRAIGNVT